MLRTVGARSAPVDPGIDGGSVRWAGLRLCLRSIPGAETFIHPNNAVAGQQRH
jgi:hypothetical protein